MKIDPVLMLLLSALITGINYLFWARIKRIEKDTYENVCEMNKIKNNYLHRFDELKNALTDAEKNIIERIHEFEKVLIINYVSKNECEFFKELK